MRLVDVILPLPLAANFTYSVPEKWEQQVAVGFRVLVPFGVKKVYTGIVMKVHENQPEGYVVKPLVGVLDNHPILLPCQLKFWEWIAQYYLCTLGDVYKAALPSGLKPDTDQNLKLEAEVRKAYAPLTELRLRLAAQQPVDCKLTEKQNRVVLILQETGTGATRKELTDAAKVGLGVLKLLLEKGVLETYEVEIGRLPSTAPMAAQTSKPLNEPQTQALNRILNVFGQKDVCLLHGVTSSGKTEVYIHLIQQVLKAGKQVLYLLPEIALTTQITERLKAVFGEKIGVYHSKYPDATRVEIWQKQLSDQPYEVILGVRSSVFLPFQRLGLVIVDEEHETSYKQQDPAPRYHARSAALVLAAQCGAKTLLGTATPSLESYYHATTGKYGYVPLTQRYKGLELPEIQVVDLTEQRKQKRMNGPFSEVLLAAIRVALEQKEQVILFQNRRGFAPMVECKNCGWVPRCQNCDVSLTYHRKLNLLTCHYCGFTYALPKTCPACEEESIVNRGYGTERIENLIKEIFPEAKVTRMDLDTTRTRTSYERIIQQFQSGKTDILIGTQMVTKGLDFDRVSVVGILDADMMLNYPDFRSYERSFQMMAQVSGRAGRHGHQGKVILQTRSVKLPVIHQVVHNDYTALYDEQVQERQRFHYPPFYRMIHVYLKHRKEDVLDKTAQQVADQLRKSLSAERVLGPDRPAVSRVQTFFIRKMVLKLEYGLSLTPIQFYLRQIQQTFLNADHGLQLYFDVDPQ